MDRTNLGVRESAKEEEVKMSGLIFDFAVRMRKNESSAQGLIAPGFEVPGGKRIMLTGLNEEAQKSPTVINVDSPDKAFNAQSNLEGSLQDAPREACAPPDDGIPAGGALGAKGVVAEALLEVVVALSL